MKWKEMLKTAAVPLLLLGCALILLLAMLHIRRVNQTDSAVKTGYILIDPGHGGADGGATAADGTSEKNVNLAISLPLADMLRICGYDVVLTRETDISIHSADAATLREQKISDMKNRLAMYENAALAVGIHQNKFTSAKYFGTQVFYSVNNQGSQVLADAVRTSVIERLQPDNKRELKKGTEDIFLLHKTEVPAVLLECGFLSNAEECAKLKTPEYQGKMAFAITAGIMDYLN